MKSKLICWDACVLIALAKGEKQRIQKIEPVIKGIEKGDYRLVVSSLIYVEVVGGHTRPPDIVEEFDKFMINVLNTHIIAVDLAVARKAQAIRNRIPKMKVPDAIHIATAVISKAEVFHTFDDALLDLNKKTEVESLAITACDLPLGTQSSLFD